MVRSVRPGGEKCKAGWGEVLGVVGRSVRPGGEKRKARWGEA